MITITINSSGSVLLLLSTRNPFEGGQRRWKPNNSAPEHLIRDMHQAQICLFWLVCFLGNICWIESLESHTWDQVIKQRRPWGQYSASWADSGEIATHHAPKPSGNWLVNLWSANNPFVILLREMCVQQHVAPPLT